MKEKKRHNRSWPSEAVQHTSTRIQVNSQLPAVAPDDLTLPAAAENSESVRARVIAARRVQAERYAKLAPEASVRVNAEADGELLEKVAHPDAQGKALLGEAVAKLKLTARGYHRILRVARTLADLEGSDGVSRLHIAEALTFRRVVPGRNPL